MNSELVDHSDPETLTIMAHQKPESSNGYIHPIPLPVKSCNERINKILGPSRVQKRSFINGISFAAVRANGACKVSSAAC